MFIIELFLDFIVHVIFEELIIGVLTSTNNFILRLRGKETKSLAEIKLERLKKKYEYKSVEFIVKRGGPTRRGMVLELMNNKVAYVESDDRQTVLEVDLKNIIVKNN